MAGPAATEPCVIYAQLLKTLCLERVKAMSPNELIAFRQSIESRRATAA